MDINMLVDNPNCGSVDTSIQTKNIPMENIVETPISTCLNFLTSFASSLSNFNSNSNSNSNVNSNSSTDSSSSNDAYPTNSNTCCDQTPATSSDSESVSDRPIIDFDNIMRKVNKFLGKRDTYWKKLLTATYQFQSEYVLGVCQARDDMTSTFLYGVALGKKLMELFPGSCKMSSGDRDKYLLLYNFFRQSFDYYFPTHLKATPLGSSPSDPLIESADVFDVGDNANDAQTDSNQDVAPQPPLKRKRSKIDPKNVICFICRVTSSPEWRLDQHGNRVCNRCGLRVGRPKRQAKKCKEKNSIKNVLNQDLCDPVASIPSPTDTSISTPPAKQRKPRAKKKCRSADGQNPDPASPLLLSSPASASSPFSSSFSPPSSSSTLSFSNNSFPNLGSSSHDRYYYIKEEEEEEKDVEEDEYECEDNELISIAENKMQIDTIHHSPLHLHSQTHLHAHLNTSQPLHLQSQSQNYLLHQFQKHQTQSQTRNPTVHQQPLAYTPQNQHYYNQIYHNLQSSPVPIPPQYFNYNFFQQQQQLQHGYLHNMENIVHNQQRPVFQQQMYIQPK